MIVIFHEFGHFFFAKRFGVLVREFSIGMGPKLVAFRKKGTSYTLRLLPLGGYVRMAGAGEDEADLSPGMVISVELNDEGKISRINSSSKVQLPNAVPLEVSAFDLEKDLFIKGFVNGNEEDEQVYSVEHDATIIEEDGVEVQIAPLDVQLQSVSVLKRLLINFAGPMNNFILSVLLFFLFVFLLGGLPITNSNRIGEISPGGVAEKAGLKENDQILSINGKKMTSWDTIFNTISANPNKEISLVVKRGNNEPQTIKVTPAAQKATDGQETGKIGVASPIDSSLQGKISGGLQLTIESSKALGNAIKGLFTGFSLNKLGGPVMMYKMSSEAAKMGLLSIISMMAMLSMNLGIVNLFPIPALDGGKIIMNLIEGVRGKPLSQEKEGLITLAGFAFLMILMVLVTWNDIQRFFF